MHLREKQRGIATEAEEPILVLKFAMFRTFSKCTQLKPKFSYSQNPNAHTLHPNFHKAKSECGTMCAKYFKCENLCAKYQESRYTSPKCKNKIFTPEAYAEPQSKLLLLCESPVTPLSQWNTSIKHCAVESLVILALGLVVPRPWSKGWCMLEFIQQSAIAWSSQLVWKRCQTPVTLTKIRTRKY